MKAQLSQNKTSFFAIAGMLACVVALSVSATGCGDDESDTDEDAVSEVDGGDDPTTSPGGSSGGATDNANTSGDPTGSVDSDASVDESDGGTEESGEEDDSETDDDEDDSESNDDEDDSESDDGDDDSASDDNADDSETDEDEGDSDSDGDDGSADDNVQCTPDDLSQCSTTNITGGLFPMEVCCTEDGLCGASFTIGGNFTTECVAVQFQDPLISEDCEQCARTNCESEVSDCNDNAACATLSDCLLACTGLSECASCLIDNAQGLAAYSALAVCAIDECGETCTDRFYEILPPELGGSLIDIIEGIAGGNFPGGFQGGN
jgi:hypothetical protein